MPVKLAMLTQIFWNSIGFLYVVVKESFIREPDFTPSVSEKVSLNIHSVNYLRQILWWQKIQTADFGRLWNTCQFAHFLLSTTTFLFRFLDRNTCWQRTKKKKKQNFNHKMFCLQAYFANLKFSECDSKCCILHCTRQYSCIFFWNLSPSYSLFHRLFFAQTSISTELSDLCACRSLDQGITRIVKMKGMNRCRKLWPVPWLSK